MMMLQGNIWDYFTAFGAGVLVSFTPCLYPVLPITASAIAAANTKGTRLQGFVLSLVYVLGLALVYSGLAVFAALTGRFFGQIQNHPATFLVMGVVFVLFGLMMLDLIPIPLPVFNFSRNNRSQNSISIFLIGMASGLAVSPCTAPVLGTLLLYIGYKQNILHGISLVFFFSYGLGASLIMVGTFSGFLSSLPKSGPWLIRIKQLCACILIIVAGYFLFKASRVFF